MATKAWVCVGIVFLAALGTFSNASRGGFHYDDFHSIVKNPSVRDLANWADFFADPASFSVDAEKRMYRPVLLSTFALNYAIHGYAPVGYIAVNILLHGFCSVLVWAIARRLLPSAGAALVSGLFFAVHPLACEPVNYISSRSESLGACFYLGAFYFYMRPQNGRLAVFCSMACCALGLLSKETVVTLPVALMLYDVILRRGWGGWRHYAPYLLIVAAWLLLVLQNGFLTVSLAEDNMVRGWWIQLGTQLKALVYYLKLVFLPWGQSAEHQFTEATELFEANVLLTVSMLASVAVIMSKGPRWIFFLVAWGVVVQGVTLVMPLNILVNERRLYLCVAAMAWLVGNLTTLHRGRLVVLALIPLAVLAWQRTTMWRDELSLWEDAVRKAPQMYRAQTNYGKALQQAGRNEEAIAAYGRAIELDQWHGEAYNNTATIYHLLGNYRQAIVWYEAALVRYPDDEEIYQNLADAYTRMDDLGKAIKFYQRAIDINEDNAGAWNNYGLTLYDAGQLELAETAFRRAITLEPDWAQPLNNLGNVYEDLGQGKRAAGMYGDALARADADSVTIIVNMVDGQLRAGQVQDARLLLKKAARLAPEDAVIHYQRGRVERVAGNLEAAEANFRLAVTYSSDHIRAMVELGEVLLETEKTTEAAVVFQQVTAADSLSARAWYGLGQSLYRAALYSDAHVAYDRFLALWPHADGRRDEVEKVLDRLEANP